MKAYVFLSLALLAAGCGEETAPTTTLVTIKTGEPAALIALRDEVDEAWRTLATAGASMFEVTVAGAYEVIVVCENVGSAPSVNITQFARAPEDEPSITKTCNSVADAPTVSRMVRGEMVQPGSIRIGTALAFSSDPGWSFALPAYTSSSNLIMHSGNYSAGYDRIGIRRGVATAGDVQLGSIDLVQEDAPAMVPTSFAAANPRPEESTYASTHLEIGGTRTVIHETFGGNPSRWDIKLAPESALQGTDRQYVRFFADAMSGGTLSQTRSRLVVRAVRAGDPTSITLPEPLGPVTFEMTADRLTVTWSMLPEHERLLLRSQSFEDGLARFHSLALSPAFVDVTGAKGAALDFRGVPGFKREWHHDPAHEQWRMLEASRSASPYDSMSSSVSEVLAPARSTRAGDVNDAVRSMVREAMSDSE